MKCLDVALIGRPSSGKSTFINTILGAGVSIVASTPQTTRKAIRGIYTEDRGQIVFTDTPGVSAFDKRAKEISREALRTLKNSEAILFIIDAWDEEKDEANRLTTILSENTDKHIFALINKCDSAPRERIERRKAYIKEHLPTAVIFEISALEDEGLDEVLIELFKLAEEREPLFDKDTWTDEPLEDRISEIIRGSAINLLKKELPHVISVQLEDLEAKGDVIWLRAHLVVERDSQKGIVIGKGGAVINAIKKGALTSLRDVFPDARKIELDLSVRVKR